MLRIAFLGLTLVLCACNQVLGINPPADRLSDVDAASHIVAADDASSSMDDAGVSPDANSDNDAGS